MTHHEPPHRTLPEPIRFTDRTEALRYAFEQTGVIGVTEHGDLLLANDTTMDIGISVSCGGYCYGGTVEFEADVRPTYEWEREKHGL